MSQHMAQTTALSKFENQQLPQLIHEIGQMKPSDEGQRLKQINNWKLKSVRFTYGSQIVKDTVVL